MSEAEHRIDSIINQSLMESKETHVPRYVKEKVYNSLHDIYPLLKSSTIKQMALDLWSAGVRPEEEYLKMTRDLMTAPYDLSDKQKRVLINYVSFGK